MPSANIYAPNFKEVGGAYCFWLVRQSFPALRFLARFVQAELLHYSQASALKAALTKLLKFYVKVFKTSYFLNPLMDLVYIWYNHSVGLKFY